MKKGWESALWLVSSIILVFAGIVALFSPEDGLNMLAYLLGFAMLLSGIFSIVIYAMTRKTMVGSAWILLDGILTLLLGFFLVINIDITKTTIPYIFSIWLLVVSLIRIISSFDVKRVGIGNWFLLLLLGILGAILAFLLMFNPVHAGITVGILAGLFMMVYGVFNLVMWFVMRKRP